MNAPVGIFGDFESLTLKLPLQPENTNYKVYAQDLASDKPVEITQQILFNKNKIIIPGDIIRKIGLSEAKKDDISDPGLVVKFIKD